MKKIKIFVASPGDVSSERDDLKKVVDEVNTTIASYKNCILELVRWETHCSPRMGRPQGVINDQIGKYDIFVGIMWKRFGSPTGVAESGTEEEFRIAYRCWEENQDLPILFYFSQEPYNLISSEDVNQCGKVIDFRSELQSKGLVWEYRDAADFKDVVRPHLARTILELPEEGKADPFVAESNSKPASPTKVFIASSAEGLSVARAVKEELEKAGIQTFSWDNSTFNIGGPFVGALDDVLANCTAAIMVLTPDDAVTTRGQTHPVARENLVYETGLFHGRLGRNRTFILATEDLKLPSDLAGVLYFRYDPARLAPVISQISRQIHSLEKTEDDET
ncbi:MAG: nucleotide-binding protein [Bacteroidetes bacterium]|nr:nucleotide-binding protein [Bacteroidota bacterium]